MAQRAPRFCSRCGSPLQQQQPTCANCGYNLLTHVPPASSLSGIMSSEQYGERQELGQQTVSQATWQAAPVQAPRPSRAIPPQPVRKRSVGRIGCVVVLLLLLVALGSGLYFAGPALGIHLPFPTTQPPITTVSLNTSITYAGIPITVVKAQQSQSFADDTNTSTTGMVRLQVSAHNTTNAPINLFYTRIAQLALPDGKAVRPSYVNADVGLKPDVTRTSIIDFAVSTPMHIDQLVFRLGAADEVQLDVPLSAQPDLAKDQPKTTTLNEQLQYLGLNWTLVNATTQWSIDGQQAKRTMRYVTLQLAVDNTLSQTTITGPAFDYVRLKIANTSFIPVASTLPVSFSAGATGQAGTVTFLVPQDAGTVTFLLVAPDQSGFASATTNIQLS